MIQIIKGNLLDAPEHYIGHQCNCTSTRVIGLAKQIYNKYPNARPSKPYLVGSIDIKHIDDNRSVINMFSQYYPGKPSQSKSILDTLKLRLRWFRKCLLNIYVDDAIRELALPYKIGCGLAGGSWVDYELLLGKFTSAMEKQGRNVKIYKWEN